MCPQKILGTWTVRARAFATVAAGHVPEPAGALPAAERDAVAADEPGGGGGSNLPSERRACFFCFLVMKIRKKKERWALSLRKGPGVAKAVDVCRRGMSITW